SSSRGLGDVYKRQIQALDSRGGPAIRTFKMANEIMMKLVGLVMSLAPYGVFALMIQLGATLDANTLMSVCLLYTSDAADEG
ncbi:cation:dicarboxylate symporter family transporter, partial [Vibrio owensii]|uniref:cation:dicarboxylate symporter family transporter n=1 Tax=Vibrio owensii TaxID=696485 RepID=UPI0018F17469